MVAYTCNPGYSEDEKGGLDILQQQRIHNKILSNTKTKKVRNVAQW